MTDIGLKQIEDARARIAGKVQRTPLIRSEFLSEHAGTDIHLKLENLQPSGAFKLRGAFNALLNLDDDARKRGVVCVSTGNHGRAVAYAGRALGIPVTVCLSTLVPRNKVEAIEALGATLEIGGASQDEATLSADRLIERDGLTMIPPFDHPDVIAGQGTIGLELVQDLPAIATAVVPLSGGGLIAGIAVALKAITPGIRIIGISMDRGAAMQASIEAGKPVEVEEVASLADSLGGGVGMKNAYTFKLCRDLIDEIVLLPEADIYRGMAAVFENEGLVIEGGAAVGPAALLAGKLGRIEGPCAMIITGRSVPKSQILAIAAGEPVTLGDVVVEPGA